MRVVLCICALAMDVLYLPAVIAGFQALIQFSDVASASAARTELDGQNIYSNCCTLRIQFSTLQNLTVKYNNEKSRDFTNLSLPPGPSDQQSPVCVISIHISSFLQLFRNLLRILILQLACMLLQNWQQQLLLKLAHTISIRAFTVACKQCKACLVYQECLWGTLLVSLQYLQAQILLLSLSVD